MVVRGETTVTIKDVLVGEVWFCAGQSNMQMSLGEVCVRLPEVQKETSHADYPRMRYLQIPKRGSFTPQEKWSGSSWLPCFPEHARSCSAVAYFFGRDLHERLGCPVGLIVSAIGGTTAESWTSVEGLSTLACFTERMKEFRQAVPRAGETERAYLEQFRLWRVQVDCIDRGYDSNGTPRWATNSLDTSGWRVMTLPLPWQIITSKEGSGLSGRVWFRRTVDIPASWQRQDLVLKLSDSVFECEAVWFNGTEVGVFETPYKWQWQLSREYRVPAALVKPGENVVAFWDYASGPYGGGPYGGPESMAVCLAGDHSQEISLTGPWLSKQGANLAELPALPSTPEFYEGNCNQPAALYNGMVAPVVPYRIRGVIWYQGESDTQRAYEYRSLFPKLITDWRAHWDQGAFPFLFVQLPNWSNNLPAPEKPGESAWAELREAQSMALALPNTAMAVTINIGETDDVHPPNKVDVGKRLALAAAATVYKQDIEYSGPVFRTMGFENGALRLWFDHAKEGLVAKGGALSGFAVAGADGQFCWADALIEGNTVLVRSEQVPKPLAVRYGWADDPICSLYNAAGLPAAPFRTDNWPGITAHEALGP